jgi:predicted murein hydrolase (TIGR00659 family)
MTDTSLGGQFHLVWVYLAASPLLGLTLTLCAYAVAHWIYARCKFSPLANPVAIAIVLIIAVLSASSMSYQRYFAGAQFVHFLLGPATVALAIPLARQLPRLRRWLVPLCCALAAGCLTSILAAALLMKALGGTSQLIASIGPKAATTPIAMAVSEKLGGLPSLTAVLVIATGVIGAVTARLLFNTLRIESHAVRGFALGVASHGIGTARALQVSAEMGAFAGLGMGLNGILTALLAPWLIRQFVF